MWACASPLKILRSSLRRFKNRRSSRLSTSAVSLSPGKFRQPGPRVGGYFFQIQTHSFVDSFWASFTTSCSSRQMSDFCATCCSCNRNSFTFSCAKFLRIGHGIIDKDAAQYSWPPNSSVQSFNVSIVSILSTLCSSTPLKISDSKRLFQDVIRYFARSKMGQIDSAIILKLGSLCSLWVRPDTTV